MPLQPSGEGVERLRERGSGVGRSVGRMGEGVVRSPTGGMCKRLSAWLSPLPYAARSTASPDPRRSFAPCGRPAWEWVTARLLVVGQPI